MTNTTIKFTDNAAKKVFSLIEEEDNFNLKLRAFVIGGGCSGFQYGFSFDEEINEDDTVIDKIITLKNGDIHTLSLLIDAMSFQYLTGAEIDYVEAVTGSQFVIRNPNAKTTCGCGNSFDVG